ncbi:MAG: hypothetical protein V4451_16930 [Pseudomonadota bacterium]
MALSAGMSVLGQLQKGQADKQAAEQQAQNDIARAGQFERQAELDRLQADRETVAATEEAKRIRKAGERTTGTARAQLAASGVMVDSGSAININEDISGRAESDAMNTLLTGQRKADSYRYASDESLYSAGMSRTSAAQNRAKGANAQTASILSAVGTGLQGWRGINSTSKG